MKFFHKSETPKLNTKFFSDDKEKIKNIPKILIVTSGSKNKKNLNFKLKKKNQTF